MVVVRAIVASLVASGVEMGPILAELGAEREDLLDPDARVPTPIAFALFDRAGELSGDPDFGLHAGANNPPGAIEVLDHATRVSRTTGEALERMARYYALLVERIETKLETVGDLARVTHRAEPPLVSPRHAVEMLFAIIVGRIRLFTARDLPLRLVRFQHPRPADTRELERFFRAPIDFEQPIDELVFDRALLETPFVTADPMLAPVLDRFVETLIAKLPTADPFLQTVRQAVADTLRGDAPSLDRTARRVGTSPRTLQRRLAEMKTTYAAVVDDVRRELATRYLAEARIGVGEIAYLLGFSHGSTFHRAFRRWTQQSPKQYREGLARK